MSSSTWTPRALSSEARRGASPAWRVVETRHVAATMKLVDDVGEQALLEALLEEGKPAPTAAGELDPLLAAPFRYSPRAGGSRFRGGVDPGVFYGAQHVRAACAELGYWRWRFLRDAPDLECLEPVVHQAFRVQVVAPAVDLRLPPFDADEDAWAAAGDYAASQAFARVARKAGLGAIIYPSARDPGGGWCVAVLDPSALTAPEPDPESWWLAVAQAGVVWRTSTGRTSASFCFSKKKA